MGGRRRSRAAAVALAGVFDGIVVPAAIVWNSVAAGWAVGAGLGLGEGLRWTLLAMGWVSAVGYAFFVVPALDAWSGSSGSGSPSAALGRAWLGVSLVGRPAGFADDPATVWPPISLGAAFVRNAIDVGTGIGWALGMRGEGHTLGDRLVGSRPVLPT